MLTADTQLQRKLRPLITPQAAARMHMQHVTGLAVTVATMGMAWWATYWATWAEVMFPEGGDRGRV